MTQKLRKEDFEFGELTSKTFPGGACPQTSLELVGNRSVFILDLNLDPELFCACRGEGSRALGNPGARFVSDWFQQRTIKVFLIGLFKFARERLNVRRVWRVSGFFP